MQGISNLPLSVEFYITFNEEKYYIVFMRYPNDNIDYFNLLSKIKFFN